MSYPHSNSSCSYDPLLPVSDLEIQLRAIKGITDQVAVLRAEVSELKALINTNTQLTSSLVEVYNKTLASLYPSPQTVKQTTSIDNLPPLL